MEVTTNNIALDDTDTSSLFTNVSNASMSTVGTQNPIYNTSTFCMTPENGIVVDGDEYTLQEIKSMLKILKEISIDRNPELFI